MKKIIIFILLLGAYTQIFAQLQQQIQGVSFSAYQVNIAIKQGISAPAQCVDQKITKPLNTIAKYGSIEHKVMALGFQPIDPSCFPKGTRITIVEDYLDPKKNVDIKKMIQVEKKLNALNGSELYNENLEALRKRITAKLDKFDEIGEKIKELKKEEEKRTKNLENLGKNAKSTVSNITLNNAGAKAGQLKNIADKAYKEVDAMKEIEAELTKETDDIAKTMKDIKDLEKEIAAAEKACPECIK
jgi:hypothetical protein